MSDCAVGLPCCAKEWLPWGSEFETFNLDYKQKASQRENSHCTKWENVNIVENLLADVMT